MCASEVSDIDGTLLPLYEHTDLVAWSIAPDQNAEVVSSFAEALDLSMTILVAPLGSLDDIYFIDAAFKTAAYPKIWVIGRDGKFVYAANTFDPDELKAALDLALK